ncbi:hypothetical protein F2P45_13555 [Massilia sp. CCM 8733]|uniref:Uncharacterized protein n=1 Tax=Massilia mucilaginosa TaxID=2609282 RepID=A0ABX0NT90_9BURK|nr:hypothetical protein [Massilia mucilaginosa]NHZ90032.1 hypothetical protein [Massilia mucilaginosa]
MSVFVSAAWLAPTLLALQAQALSPASAPVRYKVDDATPSRSVSIQTVTLDAVPGMNRKDVGKVNEVLKAATASFASEARQCGAAAQGRPWEYKSTVDKAVLSDDYLSVIFAKSTVCAGSPDEQKEARVFALKTGALVTSRALFKHMLPGAKIVTAISKNKELIRLDEETAGTLIDDSKVILKIDDIRCGFYLKNTSYRVWADGKHLVFYPEFNQPYSFCQKEYLILPESTGNATQYDPGTRLQPVRTA